MRYIKSERLKKFETELQDLEQWLKLGLVPKKDIEKHKEEIQNLLFKMEEEKERLNFLRESGEAEEFIAPKRPQGRASYTDMPSIPDIDLADHGGDAGDTNFDMDTEAIEADSSTEDEDKGEEEEEDNDKEEEDDESYFSDRNRWRRGGIIDPDADEW